MRVRVAALYRFPVKGCGGGRVPHLLFDAAGLVSGEREWAVVDEAGQVTWQGEFARLACVQAVLEGPQLQLRAAGLAALALPQRHGGQSRPVQIWNDSAQRQDRFDAVDAGDTAAAWLQAAVGAPLRLVRLGPWARVRDTLNPVHLLAQASLDELNTLLRSRGHAPAEVERFRPNVLLGAADEDLLPFLEEQALCLRWGEGDSRGELQVTGPCVRCIVPNVNPATGEVGPEPAPSVAELSAQRRPGQPSVLGVYARPTRAALLAQGTVLEMDLAL